MTSDIIAEVRIDANERLCVTPKSDSFPYIYRAAMQVQWDDKGKYLYSPKPKDWSHARWFQQIIAAVKAEYGCALIITPGTRWQKIDDALKQLILSSANGLQSPDQITIGNDAS